MTRHEAARLRSAGAGVYVTIARRPQNAALQMLMAEAPTRHQPQAMARWRGAVDALALRARYSDKRRYEARAPHGPVAKQLFSLLEQNRVEALGSARYAGMYGNLAAYCHERWIRARPEVAMRGVDADWVETLALLIRVPMQSPLPEDACRTSKAGWRVWLTDEEAFEVDKLAALIHDQDTFALQSIKVIDILLGQEQAPPVMQMRADAPADINERTTAGKAETEEPSPGRQSIDARASRPDAGRPSSPLADRDYSVFTVAYDTEVLASDLFDAAVLASRRRELDEKLGSRVSKVARWAHRLQRKLQRMQMRSWQFDREEGELDASRLIRIVTRPLEPMAYRQETAPAFPQTLVTLLVDNSGSMRGVPIATAAVCAELLGRVLERCGIKTEVLGFTTRNWRGGRAHRDWVSAGRPSNPGRIAELRHIVYKSAGEPWRRAGLRMGAMLVDDLLKENIDGEALGWAHERLMKHSEPRKILIVISDGAPLDDATAQANGGGYLELHLRAVIERIEKHSPIELAAIGIGHDVGAYYRRAVTLDSADQLGEAIVTQLIGLFAARRRS